MSRIVHDISLADGPRGLLLTIVLGLDMCKPKIEGTRRLAMKKEEDPAGGLFAALTEGLTADQRVIVRRLMAAHVTFLVEAIRLADEQLAQD